MQEKTSPFIVLIITTLSSFLTSFAASSINVALPSIGMEFKADAVTLNWIVTSFLLATAVFLMPLGKAGDMFGRKKIFSIGIAVYTVSAVIAVFSNSTPLLIFARVLQGLGGAMIIGTASAILVSVYPPEKRGHVIGINTASVYTGLSAGPFLGGILTHAFGWRSIFYINILMGIIIIPLIFWKMRSEWSSGKEEKIDIAGSLIYAAALTGLLYGFSHLPSLFGVLFTIAGSLGFIIFILFEKQRAYPIINISLFMHNRAFAFSNLAALINYSATFAVSFFMSLYLQLIKGLTPQEAGLVLVVQPLVQAVFSPLTGRLSDRIEPRFLSSAGMALCTAGLLILAFLTDRTPLSLIFFCMILLGGGFALFSSPNTNAVMSSVTKEYLGVASATIGTMRVVGQMASMAVALLIFSLIIGKVQLTPENASGFLKAENFGFGIFTLFCFAGIFASLSRGNVRNKPVLK